MVKGEHFDIEYVGFFKTAADAEAYVHTVALSSIPLTDITLREQVMRINTELGYVPVTFAKLTDDEEFWAGCKSCVNYDILERTNMTKCLCTGMVFDPVEAAKRAEAEKAAMKKPGFWARVFGKY